MEENPYEYFINRAVTVLTRPTAVKLTNVQQTDYFSGIMRSVDEWTCTILHPVTHCRTIFRLEEVIGIAEEQILDPNDPNDKAILAAQEEQRRKFLQANPNLVEPAQAPAQQSPPPVRQTIPPMKVQERESPFVDLESLREVARMSRQPSNR